MTVNLKGYTLIIAEKPKAASKIAIALGLSTQHKLYGIPYWVGKVGTKTVVVAGVAGHLFTLATNEGGYPVLNYRWVPRWLCEKSSKNLLNYFKLINDLSKGATEFVNACDYDIEGSVIGYMIVSKFGDLSKSKRMKFSSLTPVELRKAFNNLTPLDTNMVEAGLCRHELDWLWGINVSRALSDVFRRIYSKELVLSAGRVQSPTLVEVIDNYIQRSTFVPDIAFTIRVKTRIKDKDYILRNMFNVFNYVEDAKAVIQEIKKKGYLKVIDIRVSEESLNPPSPFNLPDLQYEAARIYGFSPYKTLALAEKLYLESLISYPRTNSQKLPKDLDNRYVISNLGRLKTYNNLVRELLSKEVLVPSEGSKDDPAHPAIYPTGYLPTKHLSKDELKLYDLIVRRYLATFANALKVRRVSYLIAFDDRLKFSLDGLNVMSYGWLRYYPYHKLMKRDIPQLKLGEYIDVVDVKLVNVYSKAPSRYTKASLLKWMEHVGIGTEATRAEIIETLFKRGYLRVSSRYIDVTDLGLQVVKILKRFFNDITSVDLTRRFEELLNNIILGRTSRIEIISEVKTFIRNRLEGFKALIEAMSSDELIKLLDMDDKHKCEICGNAAHKGVDNLWLCEPHFLAYNNIKEKYEVWRARLGVKWMDYLLRLNKLSGIGKYCKDVIEYLIKKRSSQSV